MFDKEKETARASETVDNLLNQGLKIYSAKKDTFYLYSTDKELLASLELFLDDTKIPEYCVFIENIPNLQKFNRSNEFCGTLYNYVDRKYNLDSGFDYDMKKNAFVKSDMQKMWNDMRAGKSVEQEQVFLKSLIHELIKRRCPVDYFQRVFYCFEKPDEKKIFDKSFTVLNTMDKLVEYKTSHGRYWFLTGKNSSGLFLTMDDASQKMFNKVKNALQKQKQNVK